MKILIIEDEKLIADNLKTGLEQHRFTVDVAYTGREGYHLAHDFEYDVIILDLMLPDIEGEELCRRLRQEKIETFILMLTAKKQLGNIVEGLNCGADDYLKTKIDVLKHKKKVTEKEYKETLILIENEVMRLSKITEELLMLSDLEDNDFRKKFNHVNVKTILEKMIELFSNQIEVKNLKPAIHIHGKHEILGNKIQIEQLIFNLFDNAIKYSSAKNELSISLKNDITGNLLILEITNISDTIKNDDIPYIFDRFYKAADGIKKKGFGLGLSISKKIVENHCGSITADYNEQKKSITFKIILPLSN